jgi:hypothetical protein
MPWHFNNLTTTTGTPLAAISPPHGYTVGETQHVIYVSDPDGHIRELLWDSVAGWHDNGDLTTQTGAPPPHPQNFPVESYAFRGEDTLHVIYVPADLHFHELLWDAGGWIDNGDLTAATGSKVYGFFGDFAAYAFESQATQHVAYVSDDQRIHELWWAHGSWHDGGDLPTDNEFTAGGICGYAFEAQYTQHLFYYWFGEVRELWWDRDGWHDHAVSQAEADNSRVLSGYAFEAKRTQHVLYVRQGDNNIRELLWDSGVWSDNNLTLATSAPPISRQSYGPKGFASEARGTQHVIYVSDPDGHIRELLWDSVAGWHDNGDLTTQTGAPPPAPGSQIEGYPFEVQGTQHVIYLSADRHIIELYWAPA